MIIEYDLQGSITRHRGVFDTTGFWCVFEEDKEFVGTNLEVSNGWKIYGFGSFTFFHTDYVAANNVYLALYEALYEALNGRTEISLDNIGHISRIKE